MRLIKIGVSVVLALMLAAFVWYTWPKQIHTTLDGIKYRLGEGHEVYVQPVQIRIEGEIQRRLTKPPLFTGKIDTGEGNGANPFQQDDPDLKVRLSRSDADWLQSIRLDQGQIKRRAIGSLYSTPDMDQLTIALMHDNQGRETGWSSSDGFMISAPAQSREEALKISRELMKDGLNGYELK
ncbi:hypothetical protein AWM70_15840 [Paenibacillus yonginensis]|uniref:Uncharacterized protein n=1 Tax=Paenibacillus yonginensis TaxID=1462996 RepID=A0A1B1N371_9BACL|nr:hypothetical protein [Paenibacillus yonginensis]ANS75878.1 hypothetical protein AWM70_15840 [Paenibacillus yonginensis]